MNLLDTSADRVHASVIQRAQMEAESLAAFARKNGLSLKVDVEPQRDQVIVVRDAALPTPAPTMVDERGEAAQELAVPKTDDPVAWALFWLDSALRCKAFHWDEDQRACAEGALRDATRPTLQSLGGDAGVSEAEFLRAMAKEPGAVIRSSRDLTPAAIALARSSGKWLALRDGLGFAIMAEHARQAAEDDQSSCTKCSSPDDCGRLGCAALSLTSTEKSDGWGALSSIRHLVADDAHACTFQSFGQYRTALLKALDALSSAGSDEWKPLSTAPEGMRVLLGPREAPVVGKVVHGDEERGSMASVVHYNGNTLVAGYRCSEWHHLPAAPKAAEKSGRSE